MSLVKKEIICASCDTQYIIVMNEHDVSNLSCCPFCSLPNEDQIDIEEGNDE